MRHLGSLIAGILIAPVAWLLIALGQQKSTTLVAGWTAGSRFDTVDLLVPTAYLLGAGALLGLVATLRVSPVGPLVAGLALLAPSVSLFISPLSTLDRMSHPVSLGTLDIDPRVPLVNGTLPVIGALLVVAVFSVKRWRRWPVLATGTEDEAPKVEPAGDTPYTPGFGGGTGEHPALVGGGWPEATYTVPPSGAPAATTSWAPPAQRLGSPVTSGVSDHESEPPPLPSRAARPSPRPRHAATTTGDFPTVPQVGPVDRLAEAQRHAAAQTAAADAAYQAEAARHQEAMVSPDVEAALSNAPDPVAPAVTESDQQAIADVNRRTLAEAQAEASRRAAAELQAEAERRAQAESQRRALARAQAEAQREADIARQAEARQPEAPAAPVVPDTETYWPGVTASQEEPDDYGDGDSSAATTRLPGPDVSGEFAGLRPQFVPQPSPPAPSPTAGPVWPAEDPDQAAQPAGGGSPDEADEARAEAERQERAAQAERDRIAAQAESERRAALLAEAERRAQERAQNPRGDEPPTSPWSAPPRSR